MQRKTYEAIREQVLDEVLTSLDARDCDDSDWADERRYARMAGCNADDTTDSRGEKLRPSRNEGGEPCWM